MLQTTKELMKKIQSFFKGKLAVQTSIFLSRILPPPAGYALSRLIGWFLSLLSNTDIVSSIRSNQQVIHEDNLSNAQLKSKAASVLTHAGRCYYDLYHNYQDEKQVRELVPLSDSMETFLEYCSGNRGTVVVAPHLSNFDLVVYRLLLEGLDARILSYANPSPGYQLQNKIRMEMGMKIQPLGDSSIGSELVSYLKNGGVAATGIDRPLEIRKKKNMVPFFGLPSSLPLGHITLALAADVPVTVVSAIMYPNGIYGFLQSGPIYLKRYENKREQIIQNAEMIFDVVADFIRQAPEQWLMFYPVWPDSGETR
jgi:KDO2-lipid IV(A) lauroyltransferase